MIQCIGISECPMSLLDWREQRAKEAGPSGGIPPDRFLSC